MKINIPRSALREVLQGLGRVVPSRASLPVLQCVKFEAAERLTVSGTNLDQYAQVQPECTVDRGGVCVVTLESLKPFTKGAEKDILTLEAGKDRLVVTNPVHGQNIPHTLPAGDPTEWPAFPPEVDTLPAPETFMAKVQALLTFASQDPSRAVLNSVFLERVEGESHMVATDGRRLTCYTVGELPIAESCILPSCRFLGWSRLADPVKLGLLPGKGTRWIKIECGPWSFWSRAVDGTYPNWRQVIPDGNGKAAFTIGGEDVELLAKALPTFPGHEQDSIQVSGKDGRLCILGRGTEDKKWTSLDLPASKHEGSDSQVGVNRRFLLDALHAGFRQFGITEHEGPLVARDGTGGTHILMPMRIGAAEPVPEKAAAPVPPVVETQPQAKEKTMPEKIQEPGALERLIAAFDAAKAKVREANEALAQVAGAIKDAIREDRQRRAEIDTVRAGLLKLQAIRV